MRLLRRSHTGDISFTADLSDDELVTHRYTILSHTWGDDQEEVTYSHTVAGVGMSKAGVGSAKIRFCLEQTKKDCLDYFWVDTCCIDRTNSVELSEALNSMFRWYQRAEKCYVYLTDVPESPTDTALDWEHTFRNSRWFTRGWTLQELLAPSVVEFYAMNTEQLGTRLSLESLIHASTCIPVEALRRYSPTDFTPGERQEWQRGRQTKKPEDMVYSLLGLLEISLPILYGCGREEAQRKLELEIAFKHRGAHHADFGLNLSLPGSLEAIRLVARTDELSGMQTLLTGTNRRQYVVLRGLGGIGKTQLAVAYAVRYKYDYSAVLWLDASNKDSLMTSFVTVAKQILRAFPNTEGLADVDFGNHSDKVVDRVKAWLSMPMNKRWLLICDNYDSPVSLSNTDNVTDANIDDGAMNLIDYLPEDDQGSVLITTRSSEVTIGHCMQVRRLGAQDSLKILESSSQRELLTADKYALAVAVRLDGLPLALATAGAYLSQNTVSFAEYLDYLERSRAKLQTFSPKLSTYQNRTLFRTWQISFEQIKQRSSIAANLLRLWSYFDNQDLWFELLTNSTDEALPWLSELSRDKLDFERHMRVLCNHGLAEANKQNVYEVESTGYSVHACVHDWMIASLNNDRNSSLARAALECLASNVSGIDRRNWSLMHRRLLPHANRWTEGALDKLTVDPKLLTVYDKLSVLYYNQGKLAKSEQMHIRSLAGYETVMGANHISTLDMVHSLGVLYSDQGKLPEAEQMYVRALAGREIVLGGDHTLTLDTVNNLGLLYRDPGEPAKAEQMCNRALAGKEKAVGADHPSTLNIANTLGLLYRDLGKLADAEQMYMRALVGYETTLGADHTWTLVTVGNLGVLYKDHGRLLEAEQMSIRALTGKEKAWGPNHPSTLKTVNNLGQLYRDQGKLLEAEQMYMRALAGFEEALGKGHTLTLDTISNFGILYQDQGKLAEAEQMCLQAIAGHEKALGADHSSTLNSIISLALLRLDQRTIADARALYGRVERNYDSLIAPVRRYAYRLAQLLADVDRGEGSQAADVLGAEDDGRSAGHCYDQRRALPTCHTTVVPAVKKASKWRNFFKHKRASSIR